MRAYSHLVVIAKSGQVGFPAVPSLPMVDSDGVYCVVITSPLIFYNKSHINISKTFQLPAPISTEHGHGEPLSYSSLPNATGYAAPTLTKELPDEVCAVRIYVRRG